MQLDMFGNKRYKVALHQHTTLSDGHKTPEEMVKIYKAKGYDAVAITDHWRYYPSGKIDGVTIISGCEYNMGAADTIDGVMHIVGVGLKKEPTLTMDNTRQEVIDGIVAAGGMAILAHPAWSLNTPEDALSLHGFSATEIYNSVSDVNQSSRPYSGYFVDLLANKGVMMPLIATDDAHYYEGEDDAKSYVMVKAESDSSEDIIEAVKRGDFYATQGPEVHIRREGNKIILDSSECVILNILSNSSWAPDKIKRGENLTHLEYEIKEWERWIRAEVTDEEGRCGWSNIIEV